MRKIIVAHISTKRSKNRFTNHSIILPQADATLLKTMNIIKIKNVPMILDVYCSYDGLSQVLRHFVSSGATLTELNFLAQLINSISNRDLRIFASHITRTKSTTDIMYAINVAYRICNGGTSVYDGVFFPEFEYEDII